jgi:Sjoegren syndrome nuclear autoantigen 1
LRYEPFTFKGIEELKERREEVNRNITKEEDEREKLQNEIRGLNERLARIEQSLQLKYATRNEYDKTIKETEVSYMAVNPIGSTLVS